jgi:hypothetical protein
MAIIITVVKRKKFYIIIISCMERIHKAILSIAEGMQGIINKIYWLTSARSVLIKYLTIQGDNLRRA